MAEVTSAPTNTAVETSLPGDSPSGMTINEPEVVETEGDADPLEAAIKKVEKKATAQPKTEETEPKSSKKKLIVDKKEIEVDDEQLIRFAQKGAAAEKRLFELSKERKQVEAREQTITQKEQQLDAIFKALQDDPVSVLKKLLGDKSKVREKVEPFLAEEIKYEQMDPRERAFLEEKSRRETLEAQIKEREESDKQKEFETHKNRAADEFQKIIIHAMDKGGLPKTPRHIKAFASYMQKAIDKDQPINEETVGRIANLVREDNIDDIRELVGGYAEQAKKAEEAKDFPTLVKLGNEIVDILGETTVNLIRRADLAKLKASQPQVPKQTFETPRAQQPAPKKGYMNMDEWKEWTKRNAQSGE